jgi:site-specific recombinase XerD
LVRVPNNPCFKKMFKRDRKIPEILSVEEQKKLLNVYNTRYPASLRNKTMIRVMLFVRLRLVEVINIKRGDIYFRAWNLKVNEGKAVRIGRYN